MLYWLLVAGITKYYKFSGLEATQIYSAMVPEVRSLRWFFLGSSPGVPSGSSRGASVPS